MRKCREIFFIIYIIVIISLITCFLVALANYINKRLLLTGPHAGKMGRKVEEQIYEAAKTYCKDKIDDFEKYVCIENKYMESFNGYILLFNKQNENNDVLFIALTLNGEVTAFATLKQDELNQYKNIEIDDVKVNNFIKNELEKKYGVNLKNFKVKERKFKIINGKFILECSVETELKDEKPFFREDLLLYLIGA